ncbi:hypothetical protein Leryth_017635 [Lithospermum erythrorhizon]|nr:hypothetical protein Leryth_017635 [Lithospermum erythrorhizon]
MSDLPPSTSTFVSEELFESNDELIYVSALKKMMKQMMRHEIVVMKQMMRHEIEVMMKHRLEMMLQEKLEETVQKYLVRDQGENEVQTSPRRSLALRFRNEPSITIYTGKEIKAKDGTPIVVEQVDLDSGHVVESGPEARQSTNCSSRRR